MTNGSGGNGKDKKMLYWALGGAALGYFLGPRLVEGLQPMIGAAVGAGVGYLVNREDPKL